ncbi:SPOR domain-containing protein [Flavobacterium gelatinilyticum]|uniref:SPOR domain-containing protein n=1 Tax=Flavobacterium gelatinilyticum TaxID=3003260 RepID=UPI002480AACF|nr:SPOR domain-containing protein [Flavobacterium gelatinilyticum]
MRILSPSKKLFFTFTIAAVTFSFQAQSQNLTLNQDPKFEQLLNDKRKFNTSISTNDSYRIQIFSGKSEEAKKTLSDFKREYTNIDGTIIFNTPNYKVIVGNFKSRIEAERNMIEIRKKYKNIFLIKPGK